jgi:hypothetical protein
MSNPFKYFQILQSFRRKFAETIKTNICTGKVQVFTIASVADYARVLYDLQTLDSFCDAFDVELEWTANDVICVLYSQKDQDFLVQVFKANEF